jgi:BASS family bile acid:Na+ symporter
MAVLQQLIPLIIKISLVGLISAIGMEATTAELFSLFRRPLQLFKAVMAVNVIVPVAAALLVLGGLFPLTPVVRMGIMVMAVSPMPPFVPGRVLKTGAEKTYCMGLYGALVLLSVLIVPVTVDIVSRAAGVPEALPPLAVAGNVATTVVLPLLLGMGLRRLAPGLAGRLSPILSKLAMVLLLVALVPLVIATWPGIQALIGNGTLLAMALVVAVGLAAGHLLGGPDRGERGALAIAAATRHPGLALMIATAVGGDKRVMAAIVAFLLVGIIVSTPYQIWLMRRAGAEAAPRLEPGAYSR